MSTLLKNGKYVVTEYEKILQRGQAQLEKLTDKVCDDVRREHLIPFCDKKGVKFVSGMGSWAFYDSRGEVLWNRQIPKRLLHLLEASTYSYHNSLGSFINDYTPKGFKEDS